MSHKRTFEELGAAFPLFDAPPTDALDFVPEGECSMCGKRHAVCFELGIGSDVVIECASCGAENGLDADDRCDGNCHACGAGIKFPPIPEERILCCYTCLRTGRAAITKDTMFGMISFDQVVEGLTHGVPKLKRSDFDVVKTDSGWDRVRLPKEMMLELVRTPTYATIQGECWQFCCRRPMVFIGTWSRADFAARAPDSNGQNFFKEVVQDVVPGLWEDQLHDETGVYVFRCPTCGRLTGHWDLA